MKILVEESLLRQVLEALEYSEGGWAQFNPIITALRAALKRQEKAELVGYLDGRGRFFYAHDPMMVADHKGMAAVCADPAPTVSEDVEAILGEANRIAPVLRKKGHYLAANIMEHLVSLVTNHAPAIPEGWQLVPKSLTASMYRAATQCFDNEKLFGENMKDVYKAMLAAAPKQP